MDERKVERVEVDGMELHVEAVDEDPEARPGDRGPHTALPPKIESWRRRSVTGAVLTGFAFGLREVLEPEREETSIVVQVSGEPVKDLAVQAHLDEQKPRDSVVTVRPWLLRETEAEAAGSEASNDAGSGPDRPGTAGDTPEQ